MSHPLQARIVALRKAGHSYGRIALTLGTSRNVVAGVLDRCGARPRVPTVDRVGFGGRRSRYTEAERAKAAERSYREGVDKIAAEFEVTRNAVYRWRWACEEVAA